MKMDESQEIQNKINPMEESNVERSGDAGDMLPLTSVQTEERMKEALHHRARQGDEAFLPIPLKRADSGSHQHHIQDLESGTGTQEQPTDKNNVVHTALLDEIDHSTGPKTETKRKTGKKENTLTRMLKGIRVDKNNQDESEDKLGAHISISKIFQRINPVGKASRESFSKVFHRIGDALQKKTDGEDCTAPKDRTLENRGWDCQPETSRSNHGDQKCPMIGEKKFRLRPSNTDARKTTG